MTCMNHYLRIKLHFAGVTYDEYLSMNAHERAETNRKGYLLFKEWEANQFRN